MSHQPPADSSVAIGVAPDETNPSKSASAKLETPSGSTSAPLSDLASGAVEGAKGVASDLAQTAKDGASTMWDNLKGAVDGQKKVGADRIEGIAGAMRDAADALDKEAPPVAKYIRVAARELGNASEALRQRSLSELGGTLETFAKRKSGLFLGLTALGGFALVRFLNSSKHTEGPEPQSDPARLDAAHEAIGQDGARPYGSTVR